MCTRVVWTDLFILISFWVAYCFNYISYIFILIPYFQTQTQIHNYNNLLWKSRPLLNNENEDIRISIKCQ